MKIALALSGGGFRATVFHLGVLARLAEQDHLEKVTFLSTVSGGSLCAGLVYSLNHTCWPTSNEYLQHVLPEARRILTTVDLQRSMIFRVLGSLWTLADTRADDLSSLMQKEWGITAKLSDLPEQPRWMINATCHETGKNWRFERFRMGDYLFGYSYDTQIALSDAMAASAGFPGLIGPLELDTTKMRWFQYIHGDMPQPVEGVEAQTQRKTRDIQPAFPLVHLWDGGVYDNHGLEGLHDFNTGWRKNFEFLLVSDAAGRPKPSRYRWGIPSLYRIATEIMMDQVRSLRTRAILERLSVHKDPGVFLQTGNTCAQVLKAGGKEAEVNQLAPFCLDDKQAQLAAEMPTVIRKLTQEEFERLFRHGYEVADYTLYAFGGPEFPYIGYQKSH